MSKLVWIFARHTCPKVCFLPLRFMTPLQQVKPLISCIWAPARHHFYRMLHERNAKTIVHELTYSPQHFGRNIRECTFWHMRPRRFRSDCAFAQTDPNLYWARFWNPRIQVSSCGERRLWSGCADAQVTLSLRWTYISKCTLSHVSAHFTIFQDACTAIAVLLQYIYLVVFFLMLAEGIEIAVMVVYVFTTKSRIKWLIPLAWCKYTKRIHTFTAVLWLPLGKALFASRFISNETILFWLTICSLKPCIFSISIFCSQIFTLNLYV